MASVGQKTVSGGHLIAIFGLYDKCGRCREMTWVIVCHVQLNKLPTPTHKIHEQKCLSDKGLINPSAATVLQPVGLSIVDSSCMAASRPSDAVASPHNLHKQVETIQNEWATRFAHLKALVTLVGRQMDNPLLSVPRGTLVCIWENDCWIRRCCRIRIRGVTCPNCVFFGRASLSG